MSAIFRYDWPDEYRFHGARGYWLYGTNGTDLWFEIGCTDGTWWFDGYLLGRNRIPGGAGHVANFARWLMEPPPIESHEKQFLLVDDAPLRLPRRRLIVEGEEVPVHTYSALLDIEILIGREELGGPEYLSVIASGTETINGRRIGVNLCDPYTSEPLDRSRLERAANALFAAAERGFPA